MMWKVIRLLGVAAVVAATSGTAVSDTRADDPPACPSSTENAYTMTTRALTGPTATDVELRFKGADGCAAVETVAKVQLKTFDAAGNLAGVLNMENRGVNAGLAVIDVDRIEPGRRIEADVLVQTATPPRAYVLREVMTSKLRPDLRVTVPARVQTLTNRPATVTATVTELNRDVGATAKITLSPVAGLGETKDVTVAAGETAKVVFTTAAFEAPTPVDFTITVADADPVETDTTNNDAKVTVDVTKHELDSSELVLESLGGYGFQFNQHVYAPVTLNAIDPTNPPEELPDATALESAVKDLRPQLVRIFYNDRWEERMTTSPDNLESFKETVALANAAGATINITYHALDVAKTQPDTAMARFADVLRDVVADLKAKQGHSNVRWVTVGNEPNSTLVTLDQYEGLCRALDRELRARDLRGEIGLIGGDLVESGPIGHRPWFDYMVTHMNDVFDAWAEHIYWQYDGTFRMEQRLKDVAHLVHQELPENARKPTFITEYGVRGTDTCGTKPTVRFAYYKDAPACTELRRMSLAAFHKLWFTIQSAQLGFDGAINWDLYWGKYDNTTPPNQSFWEIGLEDDGLGSKKWVVYPSYNAMHMLLQTTGHGWQVLRVRPWARDDEETRTDDPHPDQREQEIAAYQGQNGQMTLLGLDTNGRALTAPNGVSSSYSIGNLTAGTEFNLLIWNANGDGSYAPAGKVTANTAGVVRFDVPLQAAFALTTVPLS